MFTSFRKLDSDYVCDVTYPKNMYDETILMMMESLSRSRLSFVLNINKKQKNIYFHMKKFMISYAIPNQCLIRSSSTRQLRRIIVVTIINMLNP